MYAPHALDAHIGRAARQVAGLELVVKCVVFRMMRVESEVFELFFAADTLGKLASRGAKLVKAGLADAQVASELTEAFNEAMEVASRRNTVLHSVVALDGRTGGDVLVSFGSSIHPDFKGDIKSALDDLARDAHELAMRFSEFLSRAPVSSGRVSADRAPRKRDEGAGR